MTRVLVLAPHPDDEALGCGGALRLHAQAGDHVAAVWLTSGELGLPVAAEEAHAIREAEARASAGLLGIGTTVFLRLPDWTLGEDVPGAAEALGRVLDDLRPALVYVPHPAEWHPDHAVSLAVLRRAMPAGQQPKILGYEVWSPLTRHDKVVDTTTVHTVKLAAARAHASQHGIYDYARAVEGLGAYRGVMAGRVAYAEVFADLTEETR